MVMNAQTLVALPGAPELGHIFQQVLLLSWFQNYRCEDTGRIAFHVVPPVVVGIQVRLHALSLDMAFHDVVHEMLQESPLPAHGSEGERFDPLANSFVGALCAAEPHFKRSPSVPEPMF